MRQRLGNTVDVSPEIAIGENVYYVSTLIDKHLHAGQDNVKVFTTDGKSKLLKKGDWIGKLFSFDIQKDAKTGADMGRLMFWQNDGYFKGNKVYFVEFTGKNTVSEAILKYNYKVSAVKSVANPWVLLAPGIFIPLWLYKKWKEQQDGGTLPTKDQVDTKDAERDAALDATKDGLFNGSWDEILKKFLLPVVLGVAGLILLSNVSRR